MNENIDLTKILKNCPKGWKFYSSVNGNVKFSTINNDSKHPIRFSYINKYREEENGSVTKEGLYIDSYNGECTFFPSREQRDWSKFTAPWYKKDKFDPKTLIPFDRVIVRNIQNNIWHIQNFSHIEEKHTQYPFFCLCDSYAYCIPYNDETKHLVGTSNEAPEYYRYWED